MAVVYPALLSLMLTALTLTSYYRYNSGHERATSGSVSEQGGDRNLTVYAMAVGQGDGNIILCPNGRDIIIVDMGATRCKYTNNSYGGYLLKKLGALNMNIHIVVTHPDADHYSFLPASFPNDDKLTKSIKEIVLGGSYKAYEEKKRFRPWLRSMSRIIPVYTVNNGDECFGNSACRWTPVSTAAIKKTKKPPSKDLWQFCGDSVHITVLGANICGKTRCNNKNGHSIILKLVYKEWSLFLSGDFEGKDQQNKLMNRWSQPMLQSTYYKVAHHGSWTKQQVNLDSLLQKIRPKRAYVSQAHPVMTYCMNFLHPRCEVFDGLIDAGIDGIDSSPPVFCWNDKFRRIEQRTGYAIYETCRQYDTALDLQICQDIVITTDGYSDHTTYVSVNSRYIFRKDPYKVKGKKCSVREWQKLKHQVSQLQPALAAV